MENRSYYVFFLIVSLSLLAFLTNSSIALSSPSNHFVKLANNSSQENNGFSNNTDIPEVVSSHPCVINYTYKDLCNNSDTIVIGTVKRIQSKWNTIDGKQPNDTTTSFIYTDNIINVEKYLKNPLTSKEILVRTIGGTVGNISRTDDLEANFKVGEKVLLFLYKDDFSNDVSSEPSFSVTDFYKGKFTLTDDGKATVLLDNTTTTLAELLSVINQTENITNYSVTAKNEVTLGKQEGNLNSTPKSKNAPFLRPMWVLAVMLVVVVILRKNN